VGHLLHLQRKRESGFAVVVHKHKPIISNHNEVLFSCPRGNQNLPWVDTVRYLGVYFGSSKKLKCSLDHTKRSFSSVNTVFGKIDRLVSEDVVFHLVDVCLLFYMLLKFVLCRSQT